MPVRADIILTLGGAVFFRDTAQLHIAAQRTQGDFQAVDSAMKLSPVSMTVTWRQPE